MFIRVHLWLKNVSKLKLPDTPSIDVTNQQVSGVESEIVERGVRHITRAWGKLRRVQSIEIIKPDLKLIALHWCELEIDRFSQTKIQPVLLWTTQNVSARQT